MIDGCEFLNDEVVRLYDKYRPQLEVLGKKIALDLEACLNDHGFRFNPDMPAYLNDRARTWLATGAMGYWFEGANHAIGSEIVEHPDGTNDFNDFIVGPSDAV